MTGRPLAEVLDEAATVHADRAALRVVVAVRAGRGDRPAARAAASLCVDLTRRHHQLQAEALDLFDQALADAS